MEEKEKQEIALKYISKGYGAEEIRFGDDLYGKEQYANDVIEYYIECQEIGTKAFSEKYQVKY